MLSISKFVPRKVLLFALIVTTILIVNVVVFFLIRASMRQFYIATMGYKETFDDFPEEQKPEKIVDYNVLFQQLPKKNVKRKARVTASYSHSMVKFASDVYGEEGVMSNSFLNVKKRCKRSRHGELKKINEKPFLIQPQSLCRGRVFLLVAIITSADNSYARNQIRNTWASLRVYASHPVEFIFVLGKNSRKHSSVQADIKKEAEAFQDMLQVDSDEIFKYKARHCIHGLLRWTTLNCRQVSYLFKTDEVIFLDVFHAVQFLHTVRPSHFLCKTKRDKPNRARRSQEYIPRGIYRYKFFPTNCFGFGYFINGMILKDLYACSTLLDDKKFWVPDVFFTGIIAQKLSLTRQQFWPDHSWTYFKPSLAGRSASEYLFLRAGQPNIAMLYWHKTWKSLFLVYE